ASPLRRGSEKDGSAEHGTFQPKMTSAPRRSTSRSPARTVDRPADTLTAHPNREHEMKKTSPSALSRLGEDARLPLLSWRGILYVWMPILALLTCGILISQKLIHPAPTTIRILSGPDGSSYRSNAEKYKKIIERSGVKVIVLPSHGALDNLQQLANPKV